MVARCLRPERPCPRARAGREVAEGYRLFDFALGDHSYKRRCGARQRPLLELRQSLSLRGVPRLGLEQARGFVRARPRLALATRQFLTAIGSGAASGGEHMT
jgi:CelD/BcsL family acetyltransferase involved in cellulose biosynthesis